MKRYAIWVVSLAVLLALGCCSLADEPLAPARDKLFGVLFPGDAPDQAAVQAYENSALTVAFVRARWAEIQPTCPQDGSPAYDFSSLDSAAFAKSSKTRICVVDLNVPWASEVQSFARLRQLTEGFVTALAKHAGELGINRFWLSADVYYGNRRPKADYISDLKSFYSAVKAAGKDNLVLAGPFEASEETVRGFLSAGGSEIYDVLVLDACSDDPRLGVDILSIYRVRGMMNVAGGAAKTIFVAAPVKEPLESRVENAYRSILTRRDFYDPDWVIGAAVVGNVHAAALAAFPPKIPAHKFEGVLRTEVPVLNYVAGKPYALNLKFTNLGGKEVKLDKFSVGFPDAKGFSVEVKPPAELPRTAAPRASAEAEFTVTFPSEAIGKALMVRGELEYSVDGKSHFTDCYCPALVVGELQLTLLPQRLILGPEKEQKPVGLSVINHNDKLFAGDVTLKPYAGLKTSVTTRKMVIDPFGLDAFVFNVEREKELAAGHYAILVDVAGKLNDWVAVDVALPIRRAPGKITIDGGLADWQGVSPVKITKRVGNAVEPVGNAWFAYDQSNLYLAFETDESKRPRSGEEGRMTQQDNVIIAFDPLMNGSATAAGGYRDDDYEYFLQATDAGPAARRVQGGKGLASGIVRGIPFAFKHEGRKNIYEIAFPWREIAPLDAKSTGYFGLSFALNRGTSAQPDYVEWGGGIVSNKDPRAFVPAILVK